MRCDQIISRTGNEVHGLFVLPSTPMWGRYPWQGLSLVWCGVHAKVGQCFGSTQNGVAGLGFESEVMSNEAVLSRGTEPGIHTLYKVRKETKATPDKNDGSYVYLSLIHI